MLRLLSFLYSFVIRVRNILYDLGVFKTHQTSCIVVSIGNIEAGGTGKTPFTIALSRELKKRGHSTAIVTRGYRGRTEGTVLVQEDDRFEDVGDEALLMAGTSGVPVIKSPDRVAGAQFAHMKLHAQIVILDDGFQHRRIYRDLDIVLVSQDVYTDKPLPLGRLREPVSSLKRARFIIHTKGPAKNGMNAELEPRGLTDLKGNTHDLSLLRGKKALAVCGIARPEHFLSTLENLGAMVKILSFRDHHHYTKKDLGRILCMASNMDMIITTEKDMVKLKTFALDDRWMALHVEMNVPRMEIITKEIETIVKNRRIPRQG